jgi:hypothetical protein
MALSRLPERWRGRCAAAGAMWMLAALAGCATTVNAPGAEPTVASTPGVVGGQPTAAAEGTATWPSSPPTLNPTERVEQHARQASEALVGLEERVQALAVRIQNLAAAQAPAAREPVILTTFEDLGNMVNQAEILSEGLAQTAPADRADRVQRAVTVLGTLLDEMDQFGKTPGVSDHPQASSLASYRQRIEASRQVVAALASSP